MKIAIALLLWCILFVVSWPVAVGAVILLTLVWLLSIPVRVLGWIVEAILAFIRAVLFLPAKLLGH